MKTYQIINHGVQHEQYFQGCGVSGTEYTAVFTGVGCDAREALEDALEQAALTGWDVDHVENSLSDHSEIPNPALDADGEEIEETAEDGVWHYVSIRLA